MCNTLVKKCQGFVLFCFVTLALFIAFLIFCNNVSQYRDNTSHNNVILECNLQIGVWELFTSQAIVTNLS